MSISNLANNNLASSGINGEFTTTLLNAVGTPTLNVAYRLRDGWVDLELVRQVFTADGVGVIVSLADDLPEIIRPGGTDNVYGFVRCVDDSAFKVGQVVVTPAGNVSFNSDVTGAGFDNACEINRYSIRWALD
jgi:hypothetical protein